LLLPLRLELVGGFQPTVRLRLLNVLVAAAVAAVRIQKPPAFR
jgi:hypothetical protein